MMKPLKKMEWCVFV